MLFITIKLSKIFLTNVKAYKSEWSKISDSQLVKIILDEHITCPPKISNCIKVLMIRLIRRTDENFLDLIQSSDPSIRKLGVQLLFQEYIYVYNTLIESSCNYYWELDVFPEYLELYIDDKSYDYIEPPLRQLVNYFYQKITIYKSKVQKLNNVKSNIKKWFQLIFKNIKLIFY